MDKMVFVSPQHLAKSCQYGFSCRFEKTPFFHGNPSWEKKKHQKISPNFYGGGPRHGIFRFQRFKFSGEAIMHDARLASPRIPVIRFHISNFPWRRDERRDMGQPGQKKALRWPKRPKFGNFLVFQCIPSIHFQVFIMAVSFREGRTPRVSWPKMAISMKWGPKCHFWGVKCHSTL